MTRPHIINGELRIPLDAPKQYRWWQGGQSIEATLLELKEAGAPVTDKMLIDYGIRQRESSHNEMDQSINA